MMRTAIVCFFAAWLLMGCNTKRELSKAQALKKHDRAVHVLDGWIRDPYIFLHDDGYYYLTGTTPQPGDPRNETEPYNTGLDRQNMEIYNTPSIVGYSLRVWRSMDLLDWEYMGEPFTIEDSYWASVHPEDFENTPKDEWRLWAPELFFIDGRWVFVHTTPSPVRGGANLAITQGDKMEGPFSFPMNQDMLQKHDPSLFQDDDGTWYLVWGNTFVAPIKPGFEGLAAEPVRIDPSDRRIGHEGATLRKIGDKYVHFGTAWSTDKGRQGSYNLYYCTSDHILGPYGPRQFAGRFLGHGTPFQDKEGRWWCTAFFNGNVPPVEREGIQIRDLSETAQTINEQGTTIVPLEVRILEDGDIYVRAKDPDYAVPGPDEVQQFD
jgi:xylan 1,4-beta-xylosidase